VVLEALVSAVLLAAILQWAGIHQVLHELSRTQLRWFVPAVLVSIATVPLMAFRWRLLLSAKRIDVPIAWLTRTYFVALFAGQFLPAAITPGRRAEPPPAITAASARTTSETSPTSRSIRTDATASGASWVRRPSSTARTASPPIAAGRNWPANRATK